MKKRNFIMTLASLLIVGVLALSLTGCLKIGLKERNLEDRMTKAGADVTHERTAPMLKSATANQLVGVGTIMYCYMNVSDQDAETGETGEHEDMLYVIYAKTDITGDWLEESTKSWLKSQQDKLNAGEPLDDDSLDAGWDLKHWNFYRYDNVIMCGHYKILSVARRY